MRNLELDLGDGVSMKFIRIPAGKFMMGSPASEPNRNSNESPQHEVLISSPFNIGIYEVSQEEYQAVMDNNPSFFKGLKNPVDSVSWYDAVEFCKKLSMKTGRKIRLPSEAEWEYACRAGTNTAYNSGQTISTNQVNFNDSNGKTVPVGSFSANAWGLYDMHGNVWEWVSDWYGSAYFSKSERIDPKGPASGQGRIDRGGAYMNNLAWSRSASRGGRDPEDRKNFLGLRVVLDF